MYQDILYRVYKNGRYSIEQSILAAGTVPGGIPGSQRGIFITPGCDTYHHPMKKAEIYTNLKNHPKKIRFEYLCRAAEAFGFVYRGGRGSHRVYTRDGVREIVNVQEVNGMAKPYQVKQFCKIVEGYSLLKEDADV